jgi:hypothetical protein
MLYVICIGDDYKKFLYHLDLISTLHMVFLKVQLLTAFEILGTFAPAATADTTEWFFCKLSKCKRLDLIDLIDL